MTYIKIIAIKIKIHLARKVEIFSLLVEKVGIFHKELGFADLLQTE